MREILWLLKNYYHVLLFILLEVLALSLLSRHNAYQHSKLVNLNREIAGTLYKNIEGAREYLYLRKNNEILVKENTRLRNRISEIENQHPATSPTFQKKGSYLYTTARVVHSTHFKQYNYITIDKGRKHGIRRDMAVIGEEGIVGIVLESSANFSTVLPVINRDFRLSVRLKNNNYVGIILWDGQSPEFAILNEIPQHAEISGGDTIITSGYSAIFPEGRFVGTIEEFEMQEGNFYRIKVELGTNFFSLFYVNVISNFNQQEQHEIESRLEQ
ncbi:MAG: rod shape-determining protein MreC [Bacteroidales bacterium]|nr:rod shape-determining protein MreC [Bacteroidales bacterium]